MSDGNDDPSDYDISGWVLKYSPWIFCVGIVGNYVLPDSYSLHGFWGGVSAGIISVVAVFMLQIPIFIVGSGLDAASKEVNPIKKVYVFLVVATFTASVIDIFIFQGEMFFSDAILLVFGLFD